MKKFLSLTFAVLMIVSIIPFASLTVSADSVSGDYTYKLAGSGATITGYSGSEADIVIPEKLNGYNVTRIGDRAFEGDNSDKIQSLTIHSGITRIGTDAFKSCLNLDFVNIQSIDAWLKIVFSNEYSNPLSHAESLYVNGELLTDLVIPEGVISVEKYAFYNCKSLMTVTVSPSVSYIGRSAFEKCTGLVTVYIRDNESWDAVNFANEYSDPMYYAAFLSIDPDAATEQKTKYSGGSGTEDDPFLISTQEDIASLRYAMKKARTWATKYYYKLTNDIETSYNLNVSPLQSSTASFQPADEKIISSGIVPVYSRYEGTDFFGNKTTSSKITGDVNHYYNTYFSLKYDSEPVTDVAQEYHYWNAGFTGVFDGDGHTVTMPDAEYFFGFIENGAVVKNLTVEGDDAALAYCVDQKSIVLNCETKNLTGRDAVTYNYGMIIDGVTEDGLGYAVTEDSEVYVNVLLEYSDSVVIPETINGMPVVGIGPRAFSFGEVELESLYIPGGIREIASDAFLSSIVNRYEAVIGTVCYNGTSRMLGSIFDSGIWRKEHLGQLYNVVYDYDPIEGFALEGGKTSISLEIGETFRPKYEYYPENGRGYLTYSFDSSIISVVDGQITGLKAGETTVTVTAESGVTYDFTVKVIGYTGLVIEALPSRTSYGLRMSLDTTGLVVRALINDGTDLIVTDYTVSGFNSLKRGAQTITVSYKGLTATFEVYVYDAVHGDVNGDGTVSSADSNVLKRIISGSISISEGTDIFYACDLNEDGIINSTDSYLLKRMLVG